jgi:iron complex outermembrane recepter protein
MMCGVMMSQFRWVIGAASVLPVLLASSTRAEVTETTRATVDSDDSEIVTVNDEVNQPATTVEEWISQFSPTTPEDNSQIVEGQAIAQSSPVSPIQITGVRITSTPQGLEVILDTANGQLQPPTTSVVGNALIADVTNAILALPDANEFQAANPAEGIALVTVANFPGNRVRIAITGLTAPPLAEVRAEAQGLVFSVLPGTETADTEEETIQVVVTGEQEEDYVSEDATTATRTDTPLRDIPQSIQVVPRQVLEDQQVIQLEEALRNVSGVEQGNTFGSSGDAFILRGFPQFTTLRNGFRDTTGTQSFRDTANLEQVEVLKGPASVLYSTLEPGGVINLITEQPLSEPIYEVGLQVGNSALFRPTLDFTGPLNASETVLYRLNVAYENADSFRNFDQGIERTFVSPVVSWAISDQTDLTVEFEYLDDERPFDRGLIALGSEVADIPYERVLADPDDFSTREQIRLSYRLEHRFNDNWRVRNGFQFLESDSRYAFVDQEDFPLNETTGELQRGLADQEYLNRDYAIQTEVVGEFTTGTIEHTLLFGIDLLRGEQDLDNRRQFENIPSINIFDPIYNFSRPDRDELPIQVETATTTDILGIYLQDQITLADNLKLLLGGRFDIVDQDSDFIQRDLGELVFESDSQQQDEAFTPRIGIVYQPIEPLSIYASFGQSFAPNFGTTVGGDLLEPERGTQFEIGLRGELQDRLVFNLAAYELTKNNVAATDPDNPDFSIATGEVRSRGIELDVIGEIFSGWNVIASYAYTDAEITEDEGSVLEGNTLFGVPDHSASLWTTYEIQSGNLQGLGFGLGLFFTGERQGDNANSFEADSFVRTDAAVFYRRDTWQAAINVRNLFDVDYIESVGNSRARITPGEPLTIIGSVTVEF